MMKQENASDAYTSSRSAGYSLIEALIVVAIGMVIMATAMPYTLEAYRTYQLNSAMNQVASVVKFTRMEAIRQNKPINLCGRVVPNGATEFWTDSNNDGLSQSSETQTWLGAAYNAVPVGGVPNTAAISAALGIPALTGVNPANTQIAFDQRGAAPAGIFYLICLRNTFTTAPGYRAVLIMSSGAVQQWSADGAGNWHRVS